MINNCHCKTERVFGRKLFVQLKKNVWDSILIGKIQLIQKHCIFSSVAKYLECCSRPSSLLVAICNEKIHSTSRSWQSCHATFHCHRTASIREGFFYALRTVKAKSELMKYVNRLKPIKSVIHFDMQIIYMLHTPYVQFHVVIVGSLGWLVIFEIISYRVLLLCRRWFCCCCYFREI